MFLAVAAFVSTIALGLHMYTTRAAGLKIPVGALISTILAKNTAQDVEDKNAIRIRQVNEDAKARAKRLEEAIESYDKVVQIKPDYVQVYNNRGNAKKFMGDIRGAIVDYDQAVSVDPTYAIAYFNRGVAKQELGNEAAACIDYKLAIDVANREFAQSIRLSIDDWCN